MSPTRKEASALSREALLQAGEEILLEEFVAGRLDPVRVLRPTEIAQRAGRSKGMLYHLWPVPEEDPDRLAAYRAALLDRLGWRTAVHTDELLATIRDMGGESAPQFVRQVANWLIQTIGPGGERAWMHRMVAMLAIAAVAREGGSDRPPRPPDGGLTQDPALEAFYSDALRAFGREMVPPLTLAHFGAMLWAVLDGVALNLPSSPALADEIEFDGQEGVWSTYAIIVDGLVNRVTRQIAP
jgi:AcrR family transcriptional regulator